MKSFRVCRFLCRTAVRHFKTFKLWPFYFVRSRWECHVKELVTRRDEAKAPTNERWRDEFVTRRDEAKHADKWKMTRRSRDTRRRSKPLMKRRNRTAPVDPVKQRDDVSSVDDETNETFCPRFAIIIITVYFPPTKDDVLGTLVLYKHKNTFISLFFSFLFFLSFFLFFFLSFLLFSFVFVAGYSLVWSY